MSNKTLRPKIFYIEGNIGSGKTTFIDLLPHYLNKENAGFSYSIVREPVEEWMSILDENGSDLLSEFYKDQNKWAFPFQMNSFISRIHAIGKANSFISHKNSIEDTCKNTNVDIIFVERSVYTDRYCFAENCYHSGKMRKMEYDIYCKWHDWLCDTYKTKASGFIYLKTNPEISFNRINKRLRPGEGGIPLEYLKCLHEKHNIWLEREEYLGTPVLTIDVTEDFNNKEKMIEFTDKIVSFFNLN